jgi:hypothetical protein
MTHISDSDHADFRIVRALLSCADARHWVLAVGIGPELLATREARVVAAWCLQHPDTLPDWPASVEAALGDPEQLGTLAYIVATSDCGPYSGVYPSHWAMRDVQRFAVARVAEWFPRFMRDQAEAIEREANPSRRAILIETWGRVALFLASTSIIGGGPHDAS